MIGPSLSLPPNVTGAIRGEVLISVRQLVLEDSPSPSSVAQEHQVRIQWWGDRGPGTLLHLLPGQPQAAVCFPVRCTARAFGQYLADMEWLTLTLEDHFNGMLGEAAVKVTALGETTPFAGSVTFVQWLGSREQRQIARVGVQVLVSFTPLLSQPTGAPEAAQVRKAEEGPTKNARRSTYAAELASSGDPADVAASNGEEAAPGQILERQSSQEGASISDRNAMAQQDSPGHDQAYSRGFGSALDLHESTDQDAAGPRPRSGGRRMSGSLTFTPASRQQEATTAAGGVTFINDGVSDQPPQPRTAFGWSQLAAGHASAGLPRLAEAFPVAPPSQLPEAALPPAAAWQLPTFHQNQIRQPSVVTGIPVVPLSPISPHQATANGGWGVWEGNQPLQREQTAARPSAQSGPQIDMLIQRAERLRAEMTAAVGAPAPKASSPPTSRGILPTSNIGTRPIGSPEKPAASTAGSRKGAPGRAFWSKAAAGDLMATEVASDRAKRGPVDRLKSASQRRRTRAAEAGAAADARGGGDALAAPTRQRMNDSSHVPGQVPADMCANEPAESRPRSAPAVASPMRGGRAADAIAQPGAGSRGAPKGSGVSPAEQQKGAAGITSGQTGGREISAAVTHAFEVTILRVEAAQGVPDGGSDSAGPCYVCYHFPGEEDCLYTKEAFSHSGEAVFEATACHSVTQSPAEPLSALLLFGNSGLAQDLRFELWLKRKEMPDLLCAAAELPLAELTALASSAAEAASAAATPDGTPAPSSTARKAIALPMALSGAVQKLGRQPEMRLGGSDPPAGVVLHLLLQYSATACAGSTRACAGGVGGQVSDPGGNRAADGDVQSPGRSATVGVAAPWVVSDADSDSAAFIDLGRYVEPQPEPIQATIRLEVVHACGLQDAVRAADSWAGGSAALRRAKQTGPHVSALLALLPKQAPQLNLLALSDAPNFCPEFLAVKEVELGLDNSHIRALATQELKVELYQTCSHSEAALSKLASGASSSQAERAQDILLGSASAPLSDLLTRPQGVCKWLTLVSEQGAPVGALQIAARFTHLDGTALETGPSARSPLQQCPSMARALPAEAPEQALTGSRGFSGQTAAATVYIGNAQLADSGLPSRAARAAYIFAIYRLPGMATLEVTGKAQAPHVPGTATNAASAPQISFGFQRSHWVVADEALAEALSRKPLLVTLMRQGTAKKGAAAPQPVPLGTAEVDLTSLLRPRLGAQRPVKRFLRDTRPLVNPKSKSLGSISVKVLLDLDPEQAPPPQQPPQLSATAEAAPRSDTKAEGPLSAPTEETQQAAPPSVMTHQLPAETSTEYFSRMEALISTLASGEDLEGGFQAGAVDVQFPGSNIDDIIERSRRLGAAVGSLGAASSAASGSTLGSPQDTDRHFLDWATGINLGEAAASQRESPAQPADTPGGAHAALEAWRARFGLEEGAVAASEQLPAWEHARFSDEALPDLPDFPTGLLPGDLWAGYNSDDAVVIGQSGQGSIASIGNGQGSAGSSADEEDIDALVERFRASYARIEGLPDLVSADSSSDTSLPDSEPSSAARQKAAESSVLGDAAGMRWGRGEALPDSSGNMRHSPEPADSSAAPAEGAAAQFSEMALSVHSGGSRYDLGGGQAEPPTESSSLRAEAQSDAGSPGLAASQEDAACHDHQPPSTAGLQGTEPTVEVSSNSEVSSEASAAADGPDTIARPQQFAACQEASGWNTGGQDQSDEAAFVSEQAASERCDLLGEEVEGTWGHHSRLADSAYTLQDAVQALSKGSALALFSPDSSPVLDRIRTSRGVASHKPDQALASPAAAALHDAAMTKLVELPEPACSAPEFVPGDEGERDSEGSGCPVLQSASSTQGPRSKAEGDAEIVAHPAAEQVLCREGMEATSIYESSRSHMALAAARIQTCSDDEEYAVLDLGGGYCSSSDGSGDYWGPADDGPRTYQAPRGALALPSIDADDWMFGLGAATAQIAVAAPADAGVPSAAPASGGAELGTSNSEDAPDQASAPAPDLAATSVPNHGAAPVPDHAPAHVPCTFANVLLPGAAGEGSEAGSSGGSSAGERRASVRGAGRAGVGAGAAVLGSAARLTISEYFAAAEGVDPEPPGGSPSTARTLSDADLASSRGQIIHGSPQPLPMRSPTAAQAVGIGPAQPTLSWDALLASQTGMQHQVGRQACSPAGAAYHNDADGGEAAAAVSAAPVMFLNALPAAAGAGDAESTPSSPSATSSVLAGDQGHGSMFQAPPVEARSPPAALQVPEQAPRGDNAGEGALSRREQFRRAVAAAEAERQNRLQTEPLSALDASTRASVPPASPQHEEGAENLQQGSAQHGQEAQRPSPVKHSRGEAVSASQSLDDIDDSSCSAACDVPTVDGLALHQTSSTSVDVDCPDFVASQESSTSRDGAADSLHPSEEQGHLPSLTDESDAGCLPASDAADDHGKLVQSQAAADSPTLIGDAEVLSVAELPADTAMSPSGSLPLQPLADLEPPSTHEEARASESSEPAAEAAVIAAPPSRRCSSPGGPHRGESQTLKDTPAAEVGAGLAQGVESGVVTPRRQSTQELIARFSAGVPDSARPPPTSPLQFLRAAREHRSPQQEAAASTAGPANARSDQPVGIRTAAITSPAGYLANLGPPAARVTYGALPRSPLTSGANGLPWSPERLPRLPAAAEGPAPALASALPLPPPQLTAASVGVPTGTSSPNSFPGHRLRDMEPQAVVPALRRLWGHAASGEGQGGRAQQRAHVQRLLFPLAGRAEDSSDGFGEQQERPDSSHSTISQASTHRSRASLARPPGPFTGATAVGTHATEGPLSRGQERERLRVRNHRERPAPRRGPADAEAERIAQIMASARGQPWQPGGFGND